MVKWMKGLVHSCCFWHILWWRAEKSLPCVISGWCVCVRGHHRFPYSLLSDSLPPPPCPHEGQLSNSSPHVCVCVCEWVDLWVGLCVCETQDQFVFNGEQSQHNLGQLTCRWQKSCCFVIGSFTFQEASTVESNSNSNYFISHWHMIVEDLYMHQSIWYGRLTAQMRCH